jgi:methionyl-tRNA synthetase
MKEFKRPRPEFPKRAVVTAGMPYGNKSLHFGHIGGVFIHADTYARFLKDRIGKDNVIFVSGTDCYGSPILASYKDSVENNMTELSMEDYVLSYHEIQKNILKDYEVDLSLYGASAFGRSGEVHKEVSKAVFKDLYDKGYLKRMFSVQFYDPKEDVYLNGRQVVGKCPFEGCQSEKAYAEECSLGHQFMPSELVDPVSTLSDVKPELKEVANWYFVLDEYTEPLMKMVEKLRKEKLVRPMVLKVTDEFLKAPAIHITRKEFEKLKDLALDLKASEIEDIEKKPSVTYFFSKLDERDYARGLLDENNIRYRTGKTLVPFRLSGNIEWGVPVPEYENMDSLTFWVWPESLWAPITFLKTFLEKTGQNPEEWGKWFLDKDSKVYQFVGEDNIYFYGVAEMAMLMAHLGYGPEVKQVDDINFPTLIANCHLLFLDSKASSSGDIKPPMADELLNFYTKDQLRMHFLSLGLSKKSVSFNPKPFDPSIKEEEKDVVLKDGNLLTNVLNRLLRSGFYTAQKYSDNKIPERKPQDNILKLVEKSVLDYEMNMYKQEFHRVMYTLDSLIRGLSKHWAKAMKEADQEDSQEKRLQVLADTFYGVKVALTLLHPIVPSSCENARQLLNLEENLWSWDLIFDPIEVHIKDKLDHTLTFIEARFDFFKKHDSQLEALND